MNVTQRKRGDISQSNFNIKLRSKGWSRNIQAGHKLTSLYYLTLGNEILARLSYLKEYEFRKCPPLGGEMEWCISRSLSPRSRYITRLRNDANDVQLSKLCTGRWRTQLSKYSKFYENIVKYILYNNFTLNNDQNHSNL